MSSRRALILLDHGSRRPGADRYLQALAGELRARRPELAVYVAHLELAYPSLESALADCSSAGRQQVTVYPLFLAPGLHLERDVPDQIARGMAAHPDLSIDLLDPLGSRAELADLVLRSYEGSRREKEK